MSGTTMSLILRNLVELFNKISILHDPFICVFSVKACWFYHFFVLSTATLKVILATMLLVRRGKIQRSSLEIPWLVYTSCLQWWFLRLLCSNFFFFWNTVHCWLWEVFWGYCRANVSVPYCYTGFAAKVNSSLLWAWGTISLSLFFTLILSVSLRRNLNASEPLNLYGGVYKVTMCLPLSFRM